MKLMRALPLLAASFCLISCDPPASESAAARENTSAPHRSAVLIVSHGSHSASWREMLLDVENSVRDELLADPAIDEVRSAFMEYTEPSIATRLREFDEEGFTDVILIPMLLTVSGHSFDDIPVIAGQREDAATLARLKLEGTEVYRPHARVTLTPLLDFPDVLRKNVARRAAAMSKDPSQEGLVLVAYGSEPYNEEWTTLIEEIGRSTCDELGFPDSSHAWCGHIARYRTEPTTEAILTILARHPRALVIPVLVAVDENFQGRIIGGGIKETGQAERVAYLHDAILPDENINRWVIESSLDHAARIATP
ncbi:sirohydrochlorin chelatase [Haloferula sargassicola]|uniref:Cobalamin biosynthesis protein CbiX n=1 Tax=Haloferula sargassicola TaxID=490096 RepID=A0ABP9UQW9_9BACT